MSDGSNVPSDIPPSQDSHLQFHARIVHDAIDIDVEIHVTQDKILVENATDMDAEIPMTQDSYQGIPNERIVDDATDIDAEIPMTQDSSYQEILDGRLADDISDIDVEMPVAVTQDSHGKILVDRIVEDATDIAVNLLNSDGIAVKQPHNQAMESLMGSGRNLRRRSPRLVTNAEGVSVTGFNSCESGYVTENSSPLKKRKNRRKVCYFIGDPVAGDEARRRWPWRYEGHPSIERTSKHDCFRDNNEDAIISNVRCHYTQAKIVQTDFSLGDCAYIKGPKGGANYVGRILEFFDTISGIEYVGVQWFFRASDTVIKGEGQSHDKRRLFYSTLMDDNILDCIVSKVKVVQIPPQVNSKAFYIPPCDFYFDMKYSVDYSTFSSIEMDSCNLSCSPTDSLMTSLKKENMNCETITENGVYEMPDKASSKPELALLDLYSGCGGMSTGLCYGTKASEVDLVTRWAVDIDKAACESLQLNHPGTQIRNESAEDFLQLLKEWECLCELYRVHKAEELSSRLFKKVDKDEHSKTSRNNSRDYEVEKLVDICYGDPNETGKRRLMFQVRWRGYGPSDDTWEPIEGLSKCRERIHDFVQRGIKRKILPRPGEVDVVCGGPPCQGISGYNRFRNVDSPLDDERNRQVIIFMDIIDFLKPKYVLMENVTDILRFSNGCLARYAISRLVSMHYQARLGIMAAGCYGIPQFRLRVFLWGAHPHEVLPQFPLPTHDVVIQYGFPGEFERNVVAYDEGQSRDLERIITLGDAISDLPPVINSEKRDKMPYKKAPQTEFQKYIRAPKHEMEVSPSYGTSTISRNHPLYDHLPFPLGDNDYMRVRKIPKRKGANFRDLPGIVIGTDNVVRRAKEQHLMPSGKHWVPEYALNLRDGKYSKAFARLWWDETVSTIFCFPDVHMRAILHPEQDRVLSLRECARLQGFHDHYKFCGKIKERYSQVGNAVAVSVGRALGYALGMAVQRLCDKKHLMNLPPKFSHSTTQELLHHSSSSEK